MLAAVLTDFNSLVLKEIPEPEPGMNEGVIRVKACGICATDYKAIKVMGQEERNKVIINP